MLQALRLYKVKSMKSILIVPVLAMLLTGCATPEQNILAGMAIGAIVANEMNRPQVVYTVPSRPIRCYNHYIGRDAYGRAIYQHVCR
jgi:uncharacterized lipoprotein YajG